ncbi:hypothetical protein FRC11_005035 [Ceratobasidium sp. 423]|nr:hypothetical protein FRC11_005035 [Ceratobasidium sp. 423]
MDREDDTDHAPDRVPESPKPESHSRSQNRLLALEALFRVIIACYCGHLIGRAYAGGYDRYIQKHGLPEQFDTLRVSLKFLVPSALVLGYWASIGLAMIIEYRWKLLLTGVTISAFGSGMALLPSYRYQPEM